MGILQEERGEIFDGFDQRPAIQQKMKPSGQKFSKVLGFNLILKRLRV
jgi:hypothetical protein